MERLPTLLRNSNSQKRLKVTITGAAGNIGYALCFMIGQGSLLGPNQRIELCLLEIPQMGESLKGVAMELKDCALPLVEKITTTTDSKEGFLNCDVALLVGAKPRSKGMVRADLLKANANIFKIQAGILDNYASPNVKIVVIGNPANTNANIIAHNVKRIPKRNITALTRLDQNRSISQLADKVGVPSKNIRNVVIWGNHSKTQYPDIQSCEVLKDGTLCRASNLVDTEWVNTYFTPKVQKRGSEIIQMRKKSSAASAANAICDHVRSWLVGTQPGEIVSMAVWSNGNPYGVKDQLIFSFPVTCKNGEWTIVKGFNLNNNHSQNMIRKTENELVDERTTALSFLEKNN